MSLTPPLPFLANECPVTDPSILTHPCPQSAAYPALPWLPSGISEGDLSGSFRICIVASETADLGERPTNPFLSVCLLILYPTTTSDMI